MLDLEVVMGQLIRDSIIETALKHIYKPYYWGGNGPESFDCSGFVIAVLQRVGRWPQGVDDTAHGIYNRFKQYRVDKPDKACIAFYGKEEKISHVVFCLNDRAIVGANGRDIRRVSVEPIDYRIKKYNLHDFVAYCDPVMGSA